MSEERGNTDELFDHAVECAQNAGLVKDGDLVVITGGSPIGISGTTNIMKVHLVGHILVSGTGLTKLHQTAKVCVANDVKTLTKHFGDGDILVTEKVTVDMIPIIKKASGIVSEETADLGNAKVLAAALDIPVITDATGATKILKSGTTITIDASRGLVFSGTEEIRNDL